MEHSKQDSTPPKFYEVINWLLDPEVNLPDRFLEHKNKLNSIVPYIHEQLWLKPSLIKYLNKHINDLYNIPDPIEQLILLKKIFRLNRITKWDLWSFIPERKPDIIKEIQETESYDENNARSRAMMLKKHQIEIKIKPAPTKRNLNPNDKKIVAAVVEKTERKKMDERKSNFLPDLTQELIDEKGLILFDISLLKKTNRVLFTFIDKSNSKWYRTEPFVAEIYISNKDGVINNDYIEDLTPEKFNKYILTDIKNYTRLKYMLNDSYKSILNLEG